jgi:hypothetical protein
VYSCVCSNTRRRSATISWDSSFEFSDLMQLLADCNARCHLIAVHCSGQHALNRALLEHRTEFWACPGITTITIHHIPGRSDADLFHGNTNNLRNTLSGSRTLLRSHDVRSGHVRRLSKLTTAEIRYLYAPAGNHCAWQCGL